MCQPEFCWQKPFYVTAVKAFFLFVSFSIITWTYGNLPFWFEKTNLDGNIIHSTKITAVLRIYGSPKTFPSCHFSVTQAWTEWRDGIFSLTGLNLVIYPVREAEAGPAHRNSPSLVVSSDGVTSLDISVTADSVHSGKFISGCLYFCCSFFFFLLAEMIRPRRNQSVCVSCGSIKNILKS